MFLEEMMMTLIYLVHVLLIIAIITDANVLKQAKSVVVNAMTQEMHPIVKIKNRNL